MVRAPARHHARKHLEHLQVARALRSGLAAGDVAELLHDRLVLRVGEHLVGELVEVLVLDPDMLPEELGVGLRVGSQRRRRVRVTPLQPLQLLFHLRAVHPAGLVLGHQCAHHGLIGSDPVLGEQREQQRLLPVVMPICEALEELQHVGDHRVRHLAPGPEARGDGVQYVEHRDEPSVLVHQHIDESHRQPLPPHAPPAARSRKAAVRVNPEGNQSNPRAADSRQRRGDSSTARKSRAGTAGPAARRLVRRRETRSRKR